MHAHSFRLILLFGISPLLVASAAPLALRDDVEEAKYLEFGRSLPSVVQVGGLASGALIAPDWVLTVAHAPEMIRRMRSDSPLTVLAAGETYEVARVVVPEERQAEPGAHDIALLQLATPVPDELSPFSLWTDDVEAGSKFAIAGWGILAIGDEGVEVSPEAMSAPTRQLRAGWNVIERIDGDARQFIARFDAPTSAVPLEAGPCIGDSGGPALRLVEGEGEEPDAWHVLGVVSAIDDGDEDRIVGEYGEEFSLTSVAAYSEWIRTTLGN